MCIVLKWFYNKDQFVLVLEIKKWKVYLIQVFHESLSDLTSFYRKIHYLTREFHVKLHLKTDIARIAKSTVRTVIALANRKQGQSYTFDPSTTFFVPCACFYICFQTFLHVNKLHTNREDK